MAFEAIRSDKGSDAGRKSGIIIAVFIAACVGPCRIHPVVFYDLLKMRALLFFERNTANEIKLMNIEIMPGKEATESDLGFVRDVARNKSDAKVVRFYERADKPGHAREKRGLFAVDLGKREKKITAAHLAHLTRKITGKLLDAAQVFEEIPSLLKSLQIADGHPVPDEDPFDGGKGVDGRTIGVKDDKFVVGGVHLFLRVYTTIVLRFDDRTSKKQIKGIEVLSDGEGYKNLRTCIMCLVDYSVGPGFLEHFFQLIQDSRSGSR